MPTTATSSPHPTDRASPANMEEGLLSQSVSKTRNMNPDAQGGSHGSLTPRPRAPYGWLPQTESQGWSRYDECVVASDLLCGISIRLRLVAASPVEDAVLVSAILHGLIMGRSGHGKLRGRRKLLLSVLIVFLVINGLILVNAMQHRIPMAVASVVGKVLSIFSTSLPDGGKAFGTGHQNTSNPAAIATQADAFLTNTLLTGEEYGFHYSFNQPSAYKYSPSQWLWDSGAAQIAWTALGSHHLATADLRSLLNFQLEDGRVPEQIYWRPDKKSWYSPSPDLYSTKEYNDLTQMPVLPYSLRSIYAATNDTALLREFVPKLVKFFKWWARERDLDSNGLVTILHPWESGIDLTPSYDEALEVPEINRPRPFWAIIYPQLITLALSYNWRYKWNQQTILEREKPASGPLNWFKVQDIAVNSVYASGWGVLGDLAAEYDFDLAMECYTSQTTAETAILENLYDEERGHFVTGYKDRENKQRFYPVRTVEMLFPLLLKSISKPQVREILKYLTDDSEFWTEYPVPTVSRAQPEYNPILNTDALWRGPVWGFTNWFVMEGLEKQNELGVLGELMDKWIAMVQKGGIWEMYNPETAVGYGAEGLGMSCLIVDWMKRLGRI
ncbi:hypothetical protein MMC09_004838 [Bachmanniomyces sp. S44760]|nr:hypothetical protein [Bachmanniomyces sp. S44760]